MPTSTVWSTLRDLSEKLEAGETTSEALVDASLDSISNRDTPDAPVFLKRFDDRARAEARAVDSARQERKQASRWAGIPVAVKDLFDVTGEITGAGAIVTRHDQPATADAKVVASLRAAGLIVVGTTNMTEFAFSGIGINPHYGTPESACWPQEGRVPGGSSSGAGVSIARHMVPLSLGTDTAGSCRIPAAWNGVVGFKPSQSRLSRDGIFPLSRTLDAPGPLARTVDCCRIADALMRDAPIGKPSQNRLADFQFTVVSREKLPAVDAPIELAIATALKVLQNAGANLVESRVSACETAVEAFLNRPIAGYEAWLVHRERLESLSDEYDPNVASRLNAGASVDPAAHQRELDARRDTADAFARETPPGRFYLLPTTANTPKRITDLEVDAKLFSETNLRALSYTAISNYLDGCAITLPVGPGIGLTVMGPNASDHLLFDAAETVQRALATASSQAMQQ